jgi:hypothetical protein
VPTSINRSSEKFNESDSTNSKSADYIKYAGAGTNGSYNTATSSRV